MSQGAVHTIQGASPSAGVPPPPARHLHIIQGRKPPHLDSHRSFSAALGRPGIPALSCPVWWPWCWAHMCTEPAPEHCPGSRGQRVWGSAGPCWERAAPGQGESSHHVAPGGKGPPACEAAKSLGPARPVSPRPLPTPTLLAGGTPSPQAGPLPAALSNPLLSSRPLENNHSLTAPRCCRSLPRVCPLPPNPANFLPPGLMTATPLCRRS